MADITVQGPDGRVHTYPGGTPQDAILSDMRTIYRPMRGAPAPQRAGDPAVMNGPVASPRAQAVQPYQTDEDWNNVVEAMVLGEKNRGVIQAIQNTPGRLQRVEEAKEVGRSQGKLSEMQRHGAANLRLLDQIRATFNEAAPDIQLAAIGPANNTPYPTWLPMIGGKTSPEAGAWLRGNPNLKPGEEDPNAAFNLQNRLHHDIEGLTTKFITTSGGGVNMSDARQKAFTDTIGAMLHATTPEQFHNIANDAENILRETFGLTMPQAASAPGIHPSAVQDLMKDTSLRRRQQFDEIFGEGAADQVISSQTAKRARAGSR